MLLDPESCYRALRTKDSRFDGRFFTGVRSTGIYCRPVCPARTPRRDNCSFFACAAAAQEAGFRPCLRCRPEASPGTPAWLGTSATVSRGLRLISEGALDSGSVDDLAARLGLGGRHLRRLFMEHLGASPVAIAQTQRVLFARKLLYETQLPMSSVAHAAGFASIRRFNDAIKRAYGLPPSRLRNPRSASSSKSPDLILQLAFRPPLDWDFFVRYFAKRSMPGVEAIDADSYRRSVRIGGAVGVIEVRPPVHSENHLTARICLSGTDDLALVAERLRRIFDLGADPEAIRTHLAESRRLVRALATWPGPRVPGAWDGFEVAVRAVLGQQVSVAAAHTLASRLVERFGEPLPEGCAPPDVKGIYRLFPAAAVLAEADLTTLGLTGTRARTLATLAAAVASGELVLDASPGLEETISRLCALPGIGPWTASYIAMRALREPDAFPAGDLGLRRALARSGPPLSERVVAARAEAWRPWRAYAAMLLWNT